MTVTMTGTTTGAADVIGGVVHVGELHRARDVGELHHCGPVDGLQAVPLSVKDVRPFIESGHYLGRTAQGKFAMGLMDGPSMVGAALFGQPAREGVATALWRDCSAEFVQASTIELTRFYTLDDLHPNAGTWFLARAVRLLPEQVQMIVAFSDPSAGHHGGLYRAAGWLYLGTSAATPYEYTDADGNRIAKQTPWRQAQRDGLRPGETPAEGERRYAAEHGWTRVRKLAKHRYVHPRTRYARRRLRPAVLGYPESGQ
jgi:hypothetical protein